MKLKSETYFSEVDAGGSSFLGQIFRKVFLSVVLSREVSFKSLSKKICCYFKKTNLIRDNYNSPLKNFYVLGACYFWRETDDQPLCSVEELFYLVNIGKQQK